MKRCPQCGRTYTDDNDFCFDDGNALAFFSSGAGARSFTRADTPTQVVSRPHTTETRSGGSPVLYLLLGVLATAIVAMALYIWSAGSEKKAETVTLASPSPESPARNSSPINSVANAVNAVPSAPPVDFQEIRDAVSARLTKWEQDGEARDGYAVMMNYADRVAYYRRTVTRDFIRQDKSRAYSKYNSIDITLENISIDPSSDGNTARVILDKAYNFSGSGTLNGKVKQEIGLLRVGSEWLINKERDLSVYYQNK